MEQDTALCSAGSCYWLGDFRDLRASTDDSLALIILNVLDVLVLALSSLPDLDLASTADNTYSHGAEQVVGCVAVKVYSAIEHRSCVLANA